MTTHSWRTPGEDDPPRPPAPPPSDDEDSETFKQFIKDHEKYLKTHEEWCERETKRINRHKEKEKDARP